MNSSCINMEDLQLVGYREDPRGSPYIVSFYHYQGTPYTGWARDMSDDDEDDYEQPDWYLLSEGLVIEQVSMETYKAYTSKLGRLLHE